MPVHKYRISINMAWEICGITYLTWLTQENLSFKIGIDTMPFKRCFCRFRQFAKGVGILVEEDLSCNGIFRKTGVGGEHTRYRITDPYWRDKILKYEYSLNLSRKAKKRKRDNIGRFLPRKQQRITGK